LKRKGPKNYQDAKWMPIGEPINHKIQSVAGIHQCEDFHRAMAALRKVGPTSTLHQQFIFDVNSSQLL
jgi:hypothetical protein